jgi:hypothetical protein
LGELLSWTRRHLTQRTYSTSWPHHHRETAPASRMTPTLSREQAEAAGRTSSVTPGIKGQIRIQEYMCVRIKLHPCIDSVNTKTTI